MSMLLLVQRDNADTDERRRPYARQSSRARATAAGACCWAIALVRHQRRGAESGRLLPRRSDRAVLGVFTWEAITRAMNAFRTKRGLRAGGELAIEELGLNQAAAIAMA